MQLINLTAWGFSTWCHCDHLVQPPATKISLMYTLINSSPQGPSQYSLFETSDMNGKNAVLNSNSSTLEALALLRRQLPKLVRAHGRVGVTQRRGEGG